MFKVQFLIVFVAFNIPDSFGRYFLEAEDSYVEFGVLQRILYDYNENLVSVQSCWLVVAQSWHQTYGVRPFIGHHVCEGTFVDCSWLDRVSVCASTIGRGKIRWVKSWGGGFSGTWGQPDNCPEDEGVTRYDKNEDRSVCQCNCVHSTWGVHVGLMQSRESDNYVITGMRFIVHDYVLYLQPAQGKLGRNFEISDVSWVPLPIERSKIHQVNGDSINFFLDDLILDNGYALTGIKFMYMEAPNPKMVKGFAISVSGRPFHSSGELILVDHNTLTIQPRASTERYEVSDMTIRNKLGESLSERSIVTYEYVKLKQSDAKVDFAQSTLPLFHNPSMEDYNVLLSGFGIFYETTESDENFISIRPHPAN